MPASFLQEMAYQYLTDKETLDRVQVWQAFRRHSDAELAAQCKAALGLERSPFTDQDITDAFYQLRVANAGDLGIYALKILGGGNMPLRTHDLTDAKRIQLALLEVFAARSLAVTQKQGQSGANSSMTELLGIFPNPPSQPLVLTLADLADKYSMPQEALEQALAEEERALSKRRIDILEAHYPSSPSASVVSLH
ncbi:hypothetical protein [Halomonas sp. LBP4]|uniref:hypothetical protein n=1 Tax=Halomonas sp. LBP4 TaxID=2044917 RepID=UPI000D752640|nr:hypothetical protein [Halomonas sp. LBP4]PXX95948.1 hypothetical protein CR157_17300 [Halomonas sp. LBP4]